MNMWVDLTEWPKSLKIFVSHQVVPTIEEDLNNQVDKMTHPLNIRQFLSPKWLIWWAYVQSDHIGQDGGYAWTQECRFPLTKVYLVVTLMMVYLTSK